ncbi:MAG: ABC transporter permease [Rubrobacteraceae bacterium]
MTTASKKDPGISGYIIRNAIMPIFLVVVCLGLYLYLRAQSLDSIERRVINLNYISSRVIEHLQLTAVATIVVVILAVSTGILVTRPAFRSITPIAVNIANLGQAIPSIGLLFLLAILWSTGFYPALLGLIAYSFLPVLRNTMVGLQQVDSSVIEAARGMGMSKTATLFRVELPLAIPVMLAGIRTALILVVGTATLATFINAGGMGDIIDAGISTGRYTTILVTGAILTAVLALVVDWVAGIAEDVLSPKGL